MNDEYTELKAVNFLADLRSLAMKYNAQIVTTGD